MFSSLKREFNLFFIICRMSFVTTLKFYDLANYMALQDRLCQYAK